MRRIAQFHNFILRLDIRFAYGTVGSTVVDLTRTVFTLGKVANVEFGLLNWCDH
jgi:hypothetical protein